jgi:hypothetical protein
MMSHFRNSVQAKIRFPWHRPNLNGVLSGKLTMDLLGNMLLSLIAKILKATTAIIS